ncbi:cytidylyltransferase domain-containing protein [Clostridium formicaceticum]|uniref:Acylneuraminate cytidylyltransferase n=1 Tax=Clostridium formicaceticum TaxID=1497 RepID=A0AAC9RI49_9CLOT|nr:acylneuraminate cytidylyltransferase family protein [Clostridium formicaceticum]AOY75659.1 acylneuraminate cytidylyltransferase [Clostridium formicaceticum]ARE85974.1 N-acylneuraminate cytidylyltransferase [Clostridium formicaceticum]
MKKTDEKILCIIPARGGSKGVKRKNIKPLRGKPLIGWTIDEAKKSKYIDRIIVSTEDEEIRRVSEKLDVEVLIRPEELAQDHTPSIDVVFHTLDELKEGGYVPDLVVLLQCTSPLRKAKHIDEALSMLIQNKKNADGIVSVTKEEHPPWWLKKVDEDGYLTDFLEDQDNKFTRRQDFPDVYRLNGVIYVTKTETLHKEKSFITNKTMSYVMDRNASIDIDTEEDFLLAEIYFR